MQRGTAVCTYTPQSEVCVCVRVGVFSENSIKYHLPATHGIIRLPLRGKDDIVTHSNTSGGPQPRSDSSVECFTSLLLFLYLYALPVSTGQRDRVQQLTSLSMKITCSAGVFLHQ